MNILNDLRDRAYNTAKSKGWYDGKIITFGERISLVHSELSELLEGYRNGYSPNESIYAEDGKPLGSDSEAVDVLVRFLDMCGYYELDIDKAFSNLYINVDSNKISTIQSLNELRDYVFNLWGGILKNKEIPFCQFINILHCEVSKCNVAGYFTEGTTLGVVEQIAQSINMLFKFCGYYKIDIDRAIKEKMDYNDKRSYRHGKKLL